MGCSQSTGASFALLLAPFQAATIMCMDSRLNPFAFLGLREGEVSIVRERGPDTPVRCVSALRHDLRSAGIAR